MSYYDPKYYNTERLKEQDRRELEFWIGECDNAVDNALDEVVYEYGGEKSVIGKMAAEVAEKLARETKKNIRLNAIEMMVSIIDNYPEDVYAEIVSEAKEPPEDMPYGSIFYFDEDDEE